MLSFTNDVKDDLFHISMYLESVSEILLIITFLEMR